MITKAIKVTSIIAALTVIAGCAMFRAPQVYPDEWNTLDTPGTVVDGNGADWQLTNAERDELSKPPANLDDSVARTFKLLRHYTLRGAGADAVPQHVGNLLIGLTSFGAYRGITHPSAKTTAGVVALGSAAYAAGSGIEWGERAAAYNRAVDGLICLLNEAQPFVILPAQEIAEAGKGSGRQQLIAADKALVDTLAKLDCIVGEHAALTQTFQISPAGNGKRKCNSTWSAQWCQPLTGVESAKYQQECKQIQARYASLCAPTKIAAVYSTPAAEVTAAFSQAETVRTQAVRVLNISSSIVHKSDQAGRKLWSATFSVMNKTNGDVRRTSFDLADLMAQLKAAQNGAAKDIPAAAAQGESSSVPTDAKRQPRTTVPKDLNDLAALRGASENVRSATLKLERSTRVNQMPDLNNTKFDACISAESKYAQVIAAATKPPATLTDAINAVLEPTESDLAFLELKPGASGAQIETRLRICQEQIHLPEDGKLTAAMRQRLKNNECKGVKWD